MINRRCAISGISNWLPWTQPVLSANGVLGGASFAVFGDSYQSGYPYYFSCDGSGDTYWYSNDSIETWFEFYNPIPLKVASIRLIANDANGNIKNGGIYGSADGTNWTQLLSITSWVGEDTTYAVNAQTAYKYFKLDCVATNSFFFAFTIKNLIITATYQA